MPGLSHQKSLRNRKYLAQGYLDFVISNDKNGHDTPNGSPNLLLEDYKQARKVERPPQIRKETEKSGSKDT